MIISKQNVITILLFFTVLRILCLFCKACYAETLIDNCHNMNAWYSMTTKTDLCTWNAISIAPLPWGAAQCQFYSATHTYTPAHKHTHRVWTEVLGGRGMWYRNPCPLISSSDNYVWRSFVPCFCKTLHKSLWNWHDGYSRRQLLPPGLSHSPFFSLSPITKTDVYNK